MIVFNWPEKCPKCGNTALSVTTRIPHSSIIQVKVAPEKLAPTGEVLFECTGKYCDKSWQIELATTDPIIYANGDKIMAMANPRMGAETGRELLGIGEEWKDYKLGEVLGKCAVRVQEVSRHAEQAAEKTLNGS